jgi:hypothetical protein
MTIPGAPAANAGGYPVTLTITAERELNRLWGIPFVGHFVRWILAIPHLVVLWVLGILLWIWILLGWIPILLNGRVPAIAVRLLTEYLQRGNRVGGYVAFLMPGGYPQLEPGAAPPVAVEVHLQSLDINRWWGIPLFGWLVRLLVVIPQIIILSLAGIVIGLSLVILWIPILISGRYPEWAVSLYGGFFRYTVRVSAYVLLLPVPYPPMWFS